MIRLPLKVPILAILLTVSPLLANNARADISVRIGLSQQTMNVDVDGVHYATWAVSTARRGYRTPVEHFTPYVLDRMNYSSIYENAPMPYSVFFHGGYAIHGTTEIRNIGRPVSHGCVRLRPENARTLFELIGTQGLRNTSITIVQEIVSRSAW
jgi:lipoprotein-anchoring transpeptidase ErfK/SrfK